MSTPVTIEDIYKLFQKSQEEADRRFAEADRRAAESKAEADRRFAKLEKTVAETSQAVTNLGNPKRIYFLEKEVRPLALAALTQTLELLFEMEVGIKRGAPAGVTLTTQIIVLCGLYSRVACPAQ